MSIFKNSIHDLGVSVMLWYEMYFDVFGIFFSHFKRLWQSKKKSQQIALKRNVNKNWIFLPNPFNIVEQYAFSVRSWTYSTKKHDTCKIQRNFIKYNMPKSNITCPNNAKWFLTHSDHIPVAWYSLEKIVSELVSGWWFFLAKNKQNKSEEWGAGCVCTFSAD